MPSFLNVPPAQTQIAINPLVRHKATLSNVQMKAASQS